MVEPFTLAAVGAVALTEGVKFLYGQAGPTEPGVVPTAVLLTRPGVLGLGGAVFGYSPSSGSICAA
jgi:hypothetical protein